MTKSMQPLAPPTASTPSGFKEDHPDSDDEVVIDQEKDVSWVPSWAAGERILFVAAGSVDVVVDFSALDAGAISVSEDRTAATIRLPRATLATPALDVQRSYTVRDSKGLRERFGSSGELGNQVYRKGSEQILAAANRDGQLRTLGETSTRNMLEGLLGQLGFTDVTVTFVVGKGN